MSDSVGIADDLRVALELADIADAICMAHYRSDNLEVMTKADGSVVTKADLSAESAMRAHLGTTRPQHGVMGEEEGVVGDGASARWILDPLDGTANFVRGVPVWAALIALEADGELVVGVVSAPALHLRWWAAKGLGAFRNGIPMAASGVDDLSSAFLSYSEGPWAAKGYREGIDALRAQVGRERAFGDFWQHMMVAEGSIDIATEAIVNPWDVAAIQIIVDEAGGRFTDLEGRPRFDTGSVVSTNRLLHERTLAVLATRSTPPRMPSAATGLCD